ncbi:MAG: glycosyltransferase, partial [Ilumatobacteraceae bacterium]
EGGLRLVECGPDGAGGLDFVLAPHEFYALGGWDDVAVDRSVAASIPICTEQPGTTWFDITALYARRSPVVLDINRHGAAALAERGVDARHLRLGGVPSMDHRSARPRTRDVLFLGGSTDRRRRVLATLAPVLWNRRADLRLFSFDRPVRPGDGGLVFGNDKYDLLADSTILVNIHRDDTTPGYFEWARMIEAMANGCCVLTEPSAGYEPLVAGEHFVESADIAADLAALLDDPGRCHQVGALAASAVLDDHPLVDVVGPLLDELDDTWSPIGRRRPRARYRSRALRLEQRPLLPPFRPTGAVRQRIYDAMLAETELQRQIDRVRCLHRFGVDDHVERVESSSYRDAEPEVSVVVTLFGYAHLVTETLDSIADSAEIDVEVVVIDDHSLDDGRAVVTDWIHRHPDVPALLIGSDVNRGLPASRNLAIEAARCEHVMIMDADNLVYPSALRRLSDALSADPGAAFAYSSLEEFGTSAGVRSGMAWHVPWLCAGNYIDAQAMLRKSTWARFGGYRVDDLAFGWEDWEFWLRLAAHGERGVHLPEMLGRYRTQTVSMLSTTNLIEDHMLTHLRQLYPQLPWAPWL